MVKHHLPLIAVSGLALALAGCGSSGPAAAPPSGEQTSDTAGDAEAAIETKILLENEQVRVTHVSVPPGGSMQPHDGGKRAIYALADNEINWRPYGAVAERTRWSAGSVHFHDAGRHSLANVGTTPATFLIFERLDAPLPAGTTNAAQDEAEAMPDKAAILAENPSFRVARVTLAPGEAQQPHNGLARAVYALSDHEIEWQEGDAAPEKRQWRTGEAHWHLPGRHAASNVGQTEASWLIVELKE